MHVVNAHAVDRLCLGVLWLQQCEQLVAENTLAPIEAEDEEAGAAGLKAKQLHILTSSASLPPLHPAASSLRYLLRRRNPVLSTIQLCDLFLFGR